jgi:hypothetical protein
MRRSTKWLALLVIMAMVTAFILTSAVSAMAWGWWPPREEETPTETAPVVEETPAETPPAVEETPAETPPAVEETATETEPAEEATPATTGRIEMVVWSDLNGNGAFDIPADLFGDTEDEGIDGIEVVLSKWELIEDEDGNSAYGWAKKDVKVTGPGSLLNNPAVDYKHGCVVWDNLPLDPPGPNDWFGTTTRYKLDLVMDGTFTPIGDGFRYADLGPWQAYTQYFLPLYNAPQINEAAATISGYVWSDANADQIIEWSEYSFFPLQGWTVMLTNSRGSKIATTVTDVHGYYYFRGLKPGTYQVWVKDVRYYNQTAPYYKIFTWPPWGYNKGHYTIKVEGTNRYRLNNFGMLNMKDSVWAPLYYALWLFGNLQYQFTW